MPWQKKAADTLTEVLIKRFLGLDKKRPVRSRPEGAKLSGDYDPVEGWRRPLLQRATPTGATGARGAGGKFVGGSPRQQPGWINRMYMNPTTKTGRAARIGGLGLGGSIAADRIASLFSDEEATTSMPTSIGGGFSGGGASESWSANPDIQSRLQFQKNQTAKHNQQMKKLLRNYGIVNLINPDSAKEMLTIGMAILEQTIAASGDARQAKIFDSVFTPGNMPKTAREAASRIMKAGGTNADAQDIVGIYADSAPVAPAKISKDERAMLAQQQARWLLENSRADEARMLLAESIRSGQIPAEKVNGIEMTVEDQVKLMIEWISGGAGTGQLNDASLGGLDITTD
jgi:hypothetical protein